MKVTKEITEEVRTFPILKISEIEWDTDGEDIDDLPTEVIWKCDWNDYCEDEILDHLSDEYDWLVSGYCVEEIGRWEDK